MRLSVTVLLAVLPAALAGKWRESPCVESPDADGNTCSDYASLEEETTCEELMSLIDGETHNGQTLHCQCACPEWYEPVPDTSNGCDDWTENQRCPENFVKDTFDYHPLGDGDEATCLALCSNMPGAVCCLFRSDGLCYSHRITASMDLNGKVGAKAALCNIGCAAKFDITLYDSAEDGWGGYSLTLTTAETGVQLTMPVTLKASDYLKVTHKAVCAREDTSCYGVKIAKANGVTAAEATAEDDLLQLSQMTCVSRPVALLVLLWQPRWWWWWWRRRRRRRRRRW